MNLAKKLLYTFCYKTKLMSSVDIAKKIGVKCGKDCRFLDNPFRIFGTEPWLISIGDHVEITNGCRLITHDGSMWCYRKETEYRDVDYFAPVTIGNNVFIGINTTVLPGTDIGDNVIVGANSVVTKSIESNSVCCGVPARKIKSFSDYDEKLNSSNVFYTKNMSDRMKKEFIKREKPEWFSGE